MKKKIGFFVNPIAGLGGELGWKGTNDVSRAWEYSPQGSKRAIQRAKRAIQSISEKALKEILFLTATGLMGEQILKEVDQVNFQIVYSPPQQTTEEHTKEFVRRVLKQEIELLVFVGGDGTGVIIKEALRDSREELPVIGIPAGVKITSECFLTSPENLGELIEAWLQKKVAMKEAVITDLREEAYTQGVVDKKQYGLVIIPYLAKIVQNVKLVTSELVVTSESLQEEFEIIADYLEEEEKLRKLNDL